jgi:hypothetical protein
MKRAQIRLETHGINNQSCATPKPQSRNFSRYTATVLHLAQQVFYAGVTVARFVCAAQILIMKKSDLFKTTESGNTWLIYFAFCPVDHS